MTHKDPKEVTADDVSRALMEMINTVALVYKMDGYVPTHRPDGEPFRVPFAENFDRAYEMVNAPGIREFLTEALYRDDEAVMKSLRKRRENHDDNA